MPSKDRAAGTLDSLNAALRRIERDGGALPWLAATWRIDTATLSESALTEVSYEVLAFAGAWGPGGALFPPLDRDRLGQLFREVRDGVVRACQVPPVAWPALDRARARIRVELAPITDKRAEARRPPRLPREARETFHDTETDRIWFPIALRHRVEQPTLEDLFLLRAAQEIQAGQGRIRRCWACAQPFVRVRKQVYCGASCAQRVRDRRRRRPSVYIEPLPGHESFVGLEAPVETSQRRSPKRRKQ